jgi:hypothetical protein
LELQISERRRLVDELRTKLVNTKPEDKEARRKVLVQIATEDAILVRTGREFNALPCVRSGVF